MIQLSVIIVNYNVRHFLELTLRSVEKAIQKIRAEVIVVDNASSDGSKDFIVAQFPQIQWIDSPENVGFSRGNNFSHFSCHRI